VLKSEGKEGVSVELAISEIVEGGELENTLARIFKGKKVYYQNEKEHEVRICS